MASRGKFWCQRCDHVAKSTGKPTCPTCREPMAALGTRWRPGRKGKRHRVPSLHGRAYFPQRRTIAEALSPQEYLARLHWRRGTPGAELLSKIMARGGQRGR